MTPEQRQQLWQCACQARARAYAPFSCFQVGAALLTEEGRIITGCNVESASYGLTMCAERVAVFKMVSEGQRRFTHIAIVVDTATPTPPCGACRQVLWEFGGDAEVILGDLTGEKATYRLRELLPLAFDADFLGKQ